MRPLEFGWFLPTSGDTTCYGDREAAVLPSLALFDRVITAAEAAGFEYMLVPVSAVCWDAYITSAVMISRSRSIKMLVAARPGYVNPVLLAKMIGALDQLSGGRVAVNLIAGQSDQEANAEGIKWTKDQRYELMEEEVRILKALWTAKRGVDFEGRFHTLRGARIAPQPLQQPYPRFYLGGGSTQAWELSARHADVHLFWGDTTETIADNMRQIRSQPHGMAVTSPSACGCRSSAVRRRPKPGPRQANSSATSRRPRRITLRPTMRPRPPIGGCRNWRAHTAS